MWSLTEHLLVGREAVFLKEVLGGSPGSWLALQWGWRKGMLAPCSCDQFAQKPGRAEMPQWEVGWATRLKDGHRGEGSGPRMLCYLVVAPEGWNISPETPGNTCERSDSPGEDAAVLAATKPLCPMCCCLVGQSCLTLSDSMDWSTPAFPVLHHLQSLLKLRSTESVMPSNHLILCHLLLLLPSSSFVYFLVFVVCVL